MFKDIDRKDRISGLKKTQSCFKDIDRKDRTSNLSLNNNQTFIYDRFKKSTVDNEFEDKIKIVPIKYNNQE